MIVEKSHNGKLKKYSLNIKTKYKSGEKVLERNSDNSKNDNIEDGIRISKEYYKNGKVIYKSNDFDPRIHYTFVLSDKDKDITCPNCGNTEKSDYYNGSCSYCGTYYNVDYTNKELGAKSHYDRVLRSNNYIRITFIVDIIVSFLISLLYIIITGRTFNIYDIYKVLIGTAMVGACLFYLFYLIDAWVVLLPIKIYKDKINNKQIAFWKKMADVGVDKDKFFNNFNYELRNYYYRNEFSDIIDYDILDYLDFEEFYDNDKTLNIRVSINVRLIKIKNDKLFQENKCEKFLLKRHESSIALKGGENIIKCHNCSASIDVTSSECQYCGSKNNYLQEWYFVK